MRRIPRGAIAGALLAFSGLIWFAVESLELSGGLLGGNEDAVKPSDVGDSAARMFAQLAAQKPPETHSSQDEQSGQPLQPVALVTSSQPQTFFRASPEYLKELESIRLQGLRRFQQRLEEGTTVKTGGPQSASEALRQRKEKRSSTPATHPGEQTKPYSSDSPTRPSDRWLHPHTITSSRGTTTLMAGYSIPVQLQTRLVTGVPSMVRATVLRSHYGREGHLVIPAGTEVLGEFLNTVEYGNTRVAINWTRLVFPDSSSIDLDSPGFRSAHKDGSGGAPGDVDNHWGEVFFATSISTILSVGIPFTQSNEDRWNRAPYSQRLAERASERLSDVGEEIVDRELRRAPVISVDRGQVLLVTVERDIELPARTGPTTRGEGK